MNSPKPIVERLTELRELLAKATPGPWVKAELAYVITGLELNPSPGVSERKTTAYRPVDDNLATAAVNALPDLLTLLKQQAVRIGELEEGLRPFASFAEHATDQDGWSGSMHKERVVDWFGPSDYRHARSLLSGEGE